MSSIITRATVEKLYNTEILEGFFGSGYKKFDSLIPKIFKVVESAAKNSEQYQELGSIGNAKLRAEGAQAEVDTPVQGMTIDFVHRSYALSYLITDEALEDNQHQQVYKDLLDLGTSQSQVREIVAMDVFNSGFSSSSHDFPTGKTAFATDHPCRKGGKTFANMLGSSASLSQTTLELVANAVANLLMANGTKMNAKQVNLLVPQALSHKAWELTESSHKPYFATNINGHAVNTARRGGPANPGEVIVSNYLTSDTNFFMLTDVDGLVFNNRKSPHLKVDAQGSSLTTTTTSHQRFSTGIYDPRSVIAVQGA